MSYSSGWTWGDFHYVGQDAVFDSEAAVGGYKCKYCNIRMAKRWGALKKEKYFFVAQKMLRLSGLAAHNFLCFHTFFCF